MEKIRELRDANIGRLMIKYFIPSFIGVFVNALYNIVDRIFIGQGVGAEALSGVSVIFPVMLIIMAFGLLVGIGSGVLISINMGRKEMEKAELTLGNSLILAIISTVLLMAVGFSMKGLLLESFGATEDIIGYAEDYLDIILWGLGFQIIGFSLNNIIRSEGNARIAMFSMLISAGTNMILDPIFIFGLDMGVKGAAYATVISSIVLTVWVLLHFRSKRSVVKLRNKYLRFNFPVIVEILAIGMAPFAMQMANSLIQGILNRKLILFGGDLAVGAMGIINSVLTMVVMIIVAVNMASQPIIGFNHGAKVNTRVREAFRISLIAATVISTTATLLIIAMPGIIVSLFNNTSDVLYNICVSGLRIVFIAWPIVGMQVVVSNYYQSIGKAKIAMLLTLLRQVIVLLPMLYILPGLMDLKGIWTAFPVADTVSAIIVAFFLYKEWKRLDQLVRLETKTQG